MYVVRTDAKYEYKESAPCCHCMKVLKDLRVKRIVYSSSDGSFASTSPFTYSTTHVSVGNRHLLKL